MCRKTPSFAYYQNKINSTKKSVLIQELKDAPLSDDELNFMIDIINRKSLKELSIKYNKSASRISQRKRALFERLVKYELKTLKK